MQKRSEILEKFNHKFVNVEEAVSHIRRGQRVFVGSGAAEPQLLVKGMAARGVDLVDTQIAHLMTLGEAPYVDKTMGEIFRHNALFIGANVRSAVASGRADYTPVFLSEIPRLFRRGRLRPDVALIQTTPPDRFGYCSYGVSVDVVKAAAESADLVIAEVNPNMPRTHGDSFIHVNNIDYLVENNAPLLETGVMTIDKTAETIGRYAAGLIGDGATLQMGIGSIPNAVLQCLHEHRDLGVHTEMFSDGIIELIEKGVLTGARKTLLPGKVVSGFCMGSRKLYDFVDDNPMFEFRSVEFTNDPFIIARNDNMISINSAIEIDLTGQVCADSIGHRFYSGIGGQVDFIRGAARSNGGKSILVLPSTASKGTRSRIVEQLQPGAGVVTTRGDVHYVVTEYGVADLWGKTVRERTLSLIAIAHPDYREELLKAARERLLLPADQFMMPRAAYPLKWESQMQAKDGREIFIRPSRPSDEEVLKGMLYSLDEESIYKRFLARITAFPHKHAQEIVNVDYQSKMCLLAVEMRDEEEVICGVANYSLDLSSNLADAAFLIRNAYQKQGIGTELMRQLMKVASSNGIKGFTADVLPNNKAMMMIFQRSGCAIKISHTANLNHIELIFAANE
ncbi:MAG: GNAT family N-acetyltransferase [Calditrichia bacterium]